MDSGGATVSPQEFTRVVVEYAAAGAHVPQLPGELGRSADGNWVCQFPSTVPASVVPLKLVLVRDRWGLTIEQAESNRLILRKACGGGFWSAFSGKKSGLEVVIQLPRPGLVVGEVTVTGGLFGSPDANFARHAADEIPRLIGDVRRELKNVDDRRKHPRVAANFGITLYPIHSDGGIDAPVNARCRDVSLGGLCVATDAPLPTRYCFAAFDKVGAIAEQAILVRFLRKQLVNRECLSGGQYRVDL